MTGLQLISFICRNDLEDREIVLGVEGYLSCDSYEEDIQIHEVSDGRVLIHDNCYYDTIKGGNQ